MAARLTAYIVASIVAVTLIAGLIVGAQRNTDGPVDLIIVNGHVFAAAGEPQAEAVAIQGNKILRIGSNRDIQRMRRAQTVVIDARGGSVLPGFDDGHVHALEGGLGLDEVDLREAVTLEDIDTVVTTWALTHPDRPWVVGRGWRAEAFTSGPTRKMLDQLVPDRPAVLVSMDGRAAWANTSALTTAGITRRTPSPANGTIVRDAVTGEPTGVLEDAAMALLAPHVPQPTRSERLEALERTIHEANRLGITSVHDIISGGESLDLYDELRRDERLTLRVYGVLEAKAPTGADIDRWDALRTRFPDDPLLKAGAIALTVEATPDVRRATLERPDGAKAREGADGPSALDSVVADLDERGWQVMIQAAGEREVRMSLDAIARAARLNGPPTRGRRHRVDRIETIDPTDVPRFAAAGVIASMMPFEPIVAALRPAAETSRGWTYGSLLADGGRLVFGSDWPRGSLDPMGALQAAVTASMHDEPSPDDNGATEELSLEHAVEAYTANAAWASFDEQRKGRLAPDMLADIVILSTDVFALPPERLSAAEVEYTIFDGKVVFEREEDMTVTER